MGAVLAKNNLIDFEPCVGNCPIETHMCRADGTCEPPTCAEVEAYCNLDTDWGTRARMLCPATCMCDQPRSWLVLSLPSHGCPKRCTRTPTYKALLNAMPCEDIQRDDQDFTWFLDAWDAMAQNWPKDWAESSIQNVLFLREYGCDYFYQTARPADWHNPVWWPSSGASNLNANLCVERGSFYPIKPISYYCPRACQCYSGSPHCPDSCPAPNSTWIRYMTQDQTVFRQVRAIGELP